MASGLFALLDDVAALAKLAASSLDDVTAAAAKATSKAAGVVIDDTAVTPQYVHGLAANRELPIIGRIAKGSFRNKLLLIIPVALLLSEFLPGVLTPILMLGGAYLCFEAAHKVLEALGVGGEHGHGDDGVVKSEEEIVAGATRTDLILSAEIMVIALDEVAAEPLLTRAAVLVVVAVVITLVVYGVVALIVKMDDVGLHMAEGHGGPPALGEWLVAAMPRVLALMGVVGTAAMLWVGGHIELVGLHDYGIDWPYGPVHDAEEAIRESVAGIGGLLAWLVNTLASALLGLAIGVPLVLLWQRFVGREQAAAH